jgi:hypothetical protein
VVISHAAPLYFRFPLSSALASLGGLLALVRA